MDTSEDYYIGWRDQLPASDQGFLRRILWSLALLVAGLVVAVVYFQKPFNDHQFRLGNVQEFTGIYHAFPVPFLMIEEGDFPAGISPQTLLVGFGKHGAAATMDEIEQRQGRLSEKRITLSGTLIYGDGHAVLELTNGAASQVEIVDNERVVALAGSSIGPLQARGEILDPKCFFGVMKPAVGTIHKSCAIRCLSGGIPPVFRTSAGPGQEAGDEAENEYYIILDWEGKPLNKELLPYVGKAITMTGQARSLGDWNLLFIAADQLPTALTEISSLCGRPADSTKS